MTNPTRDEVMAMAECHETNAAKQDGLGHDSDVEFYRCTAAMLRAYAEVVAGWRPIESAPRDGTHILGINGKYGVRETYYRDYVVGSPARALFNRSEGPRGAWNWEEPQNNWASSWCPAYWMAMPEHPEPSKIDQPPPLRRQLKMRICDG